MPRPPSGTDYLTATTVVSGMLIGCTYGVIALGWGLDDWGAGRHLTLIGICGGIALLFSIGALGAGHRQAVRRFSEGKLGPGPDEPTSLPPADPDRVSL